MEGIGQVNPTAYLSRIGVDGRDVRPDADGLRLLHLRHLLSVPFENLDIHWLRPIVLETDRFYKKIVSDMRGGFCYELNGLFAVLLRAVGFRTRLVSARVFGGERGFSPDFSHAAIIVTIGELEYLADVGFGDFTAEPLRVVPDFVQQDREGGFQIRRGDYGWLEVAKKTDKDCLPQYMFEPLGRDLSEFAEMCDFQQYSPDSHFTKGKVCSLMTTEGRKTLTDQKFVVTSLGVKTETAVASIEEFDAILFKEFNIRQFSQNI